MGFLTFQFTSFAQNIPNGDFEKWRTKDHYKPPGMTTTVRNMERSMDAHEGKYALKLSNTYVPNSRGHRSYALLTEGTEFTGDALSIGFWTKYNLAQGDTARVYVVFRENGAYKGKVDFKFTGSSNGEWVRYSVPIQWTSSHSVDSIWMNLYSYADYGVDGNGYVMFDDIHFTNLNERQIDISNHGFEDWENIGVFHPQGWRSLDLLYYDTYATFLYEPTTYQVSGEEAFLGEYSLLIKNAASNANGGERYGYCFIGNENNDYYTPHFPIDTFKYLQGYYKYLPDGEDTARINLRTWGKGAYRSNDNFYLPEANDWTFFAFPINYNGLSTPPDSAGLIFYSGKTSDIQGSNSRLYLDNIELVMTPKSLGKDNAKLSIPKVYPNPFTNKITIEANQKNTVFIYNVLGHLVSSHPITQGLNSIDLNQLSTGVYYIKTRKQPWTQKIIKQ